MRRVFLDVIGTLPTAAEAREFIADQSPKKRSELIDRLLQRKEFSFYWAMKWSDLLRVKSEYPINLWPNAAQNYHHWIQTQLKENVPYDRFVRELLVSSGSNFRVPAVNFYRAMQSREPAGIAQTVALTFLGVRAESWPKERWAEMAVFFSQMEYKGTEQWKEEIVQFDAKKALSRENSGPTELAAPDGVKVIVSFGQDPREAFADWLVSPKNPWFAKCAANRVWSWLIGRGIVHEPDDFRPDNPPSDPELLAFLERELIASHYDLKRVYRLILNSKTYQLSSIPESDKDRKNSYFSHYPIRRLEAETLIDAICQVTGSSEKYESAVPEPYTVIPEDQRSIELGDGSVTSSFLEMFGRSPRNSGLESERNSRPSSEQAMHLLNSSHIQRKIDQSEKLRTIFQSKRKTKEIVEEIYLTILSRYPTEDELKTLKDYSQPGQNGPKGRRPMIDSVWALINSEEFLYRH